MFLGGKIQKGIECLTCKAFFCKECFEIEKSEDPDIDDMPFDDPEELNMGEINSKEDYDVGELEGNEARKLLKKQRLGSFLLRYSKRHEGYYIEKKNHKIDKSDQQRINIHKETIDDETWYYIVKGFALTNIHELIMQHRKSHKLYYPTRNDKANETGFDDMYIEPVLTKPIVSRTPSPKPPFELIDEEFANQSLTDLPYYFPELENSSQGEKRLTGKPVGTFLLRGPENRLRISKISSKKVQHSVINAESGNYYVGDGPKFDTVSKLVDHYRAQHSRNKHSLGEPLRNPDFKEKIAVPDSSFRRKVSKRNEPYSLMYYHGTQSSKEAADMLRSQETGTFMIRLNEQDEYRISYKKERKVEHLRINKENDTYYVGGNEDKCFTSLRRLIDYLKDDAKFFEHPLKSDLYEEQLGSLTGPPPKIQTSFHSDVDDEEEPMSAKDEETNKEEDGIYDNLGPKIQTSFHSDVDDDDENEYIRKSIRELLNKKKVLNKKKESSFDDDDEDSDNGRVSEKASDEVTTESDYENDDFSYPFCHYSHAQAIKLLENEPVSSWILRKNEKDEFRITQKKEKRMMQYKIFENNGEFALKKDLPSKPLNQMIDEMVKKGSLGDQIIPDK